MAETPSAMIPLKTHIPSFSLPNTHGEFWSTDGKVNGILVIFMCNHCPFIIHIANILEHIHTKCQMFGIDMVGINSNDILAYPEDSPKKMVETAKKYNWTFPYLFDATQDVAKSFRATCTPDVFLFDIQGKLFYRGQFDDSRPSQGISDGHDVVHALHCLHNGSPSPKEQKPAIGCNIKWQS